MKKILLFVAALCVAGSVVHAECVCSCVPGVSKSMALCTTREEVRPTCSAICAPAVLESEVAPPPPRPVPPPPWYSQRAPFIAPPLPTAVGLGTMWDRHPPMFYVPPLPYSVYNPYVFSHHEHVYESGPIIVINW